MNGVPVVVDVASVLSLELVSSLSNHLCDILRDFPYRTELAYSGILEDSM